jgi:hypothetical protein
VAYLRLRDVEQPYTYYFARLHRGLPAASRR